MLQTTVSQMPNNSNSLRREGVVTAVHAMNAVHLCGVQQSKLQITVDSGLKCDLNLEVEIETQAEGVALAAAVTTTAAAGEPTDRAGSTANEALDLLARTALAAEEAISHASERATAALLLLNLLLLLAATLLRGLGRHILFGALILVGELSGLGLGLAAATAAAGS